MHHRPARSRPNGPEQPQSDDPTAAADDHAGSREDRRGLPPVERAVRDGNRQRLSFCLLFEEGGV
jgi:hypothetical protein